MNSNMLVALALVCLMAGPAAAQLSAANLASLRAKAAADGWTFSVGENPATNRPLSELCGLVVPDKWWEGARFKSFPAKADLPEQFDWRALDGCTPVKNQLWCGSCWAFATVGTLECSIRIKDGDVVDLSEQWLINCNQETDPPHVLGGSWGCDGGWFAHQYHMETAFDPCGGSGAVLESACHYTGADGACACPYVHTYAIDDWAYIGDSETIPDTNAIKQAIIEYGPVTASVYVDSAFRAYTDGVFNASENQEVNHAIVLVGWDDSAGAWILRNSWSDGWGEGGYMLIEYGCSNVGYGACYIDYAGAGLGRGPVITTQPESAAEPEGWLHMFAVQATGIEPLHYQWEKDGNDVGPDSPQLCVTSISAEDEGTYTCDVSDIRGATMSDPATLSIDHERHLPAAGPLALILTALAILAGTTLRRRSPTSPK
ncbi:MAG TPA: C1 family peptidase [Candidatus Bathyarchaeia archaeon]|nr:C1 family peptidase [Candidatus Bathyarchaeia archaeon]